MLKPALALVCALLLPTSLLAANTTQSDDPERCLQHHGAVLMAMMEVTPPLFYLVDEDDANDTPQNVQTQNNFATALQRASRENCDGEALAEQVSMIVDDTLIEAAAENVRFNVSEYTSKPDALCRVASTEIYRLKRKAPRGYATA